ncbi:MAG TPA: glycoside hydrolase family 2 TIM barrel-domain containing protein [Hymenobacter sp.]|jgi:beta-glucuronidase
MNFLRLAAPALCLASLCAAAQSATPPAGPAPATQTARPRFDPTVRPPDPLLTNVPNRPSQSLDGVWRCIIDPMENGYYSYRYVPSPYGYFRNQQPQNKSELVEYNFDTAEQLRVPGDWNTQQEKLFFYEGTIWYKKNFVVKKTPGKRQFLYFGAANYDAKVYLNGQLLGGHVGGFTPFNFDVTDEVKDGDNFVIVKVDNTRHRTDIPTNNSDWWNFGGLTRSVKLVETPETFVREAVVQLKKGSADELDGWVQLDGPQRGQPVTVAIPEARFTTTVTPNAEGYAKVSGRVKRLDRWAPGHPRRYLVRVSSGRDVYQDSIGFRTIETRGQDILLNGKSVYLSGISIHEVAPQTGGRISTVEECRTLLRWAKELNCNFVRLAHYPHTEDMVREAERMGILIWSEIPVYWTIEWENPAVLANAQQQLTEMITRDRNRAAIVLWSVANETPPGGPRQAFLTSLVRTARALDPSRLITGALEIHTSAAGERTVDDALGQELDVLGVNNYCGWYYGTPESCGDVRWKTTFDKPMILSEFGGDALQGRHGPADERWTEEYQDAVFKNNLAMMDKIPFLRGASPWILMDFHSARRPLPGVQDFYNRKGLVSERGIKKMAFSTLQAYYARKKQEAPLGKAAPKSSSRAAARNTVPAGTVAGGR